jgi:hypothetical protein
VKWSRTAQGFRAHLLGAVPAHWIQDSAQLRAFPAAAQLTAFDPYGDAAAPPVGLLPAEADRPFVALSAASLSSPVAHPANVLIMGPGGYRYSDYLRLGVP